MKPFFLPILFLLASSILPAQAPAPYGALPSEAQLRWHETEIYCLIHYGANTYSDREWGQGDEDPAIINPSAFDAAQIAAAAKSGGCKGLVFVAKHHDGLCLWPSKTTPHNSTQIAWKNGKGDMVRAFADATRAQGMRFGVYCSPWDRNHPEYGRPAYVRVYAQQLRELYTQYGDLFISWHDGANGGDGYYGGAREVRNIDRFTYYGWDTLWQITRRLQPNAVIFSDVGWDVRWVGNEEGHAGETCWATYTPHGRIDPNRPAAGETMYEEGVNGHRDGKFWMPAECDVPLRPGWFYHAAQDAQVKTPEQLFDLYCQSVGHGACLNLGLAPDKRGRLHENDVKNLAAFGRLLRQTFGKNLATGAQFIPSNVRGKNNKTFGALNLTDADRYSYWATDDSVTTPTLEVRLAQPRRFNIIRLRENIRLGQRIDAVAVDIWEKNAWREIATATSIGSCRIIRLPQYMTASRVRLRITRAAACVALSDFGLYAEPEQLSAPTIQRNLTGQVQFTTESAVTDIRYTLDGSEPTRASAVYKGSFSLSDGGTVKARCFDRNGRGGATAGRTFGLAKTTWKLVTVSAEGSYGRGAYAIDERDNTYWSTWREDGKPLPAPQSITVDMGASQPISGFTCIPQPAKWPGGLVDRFRFEVSTDGQEWQTAAAGEFGNVTNNRIEQRIDFGRPLQARYFRFTAERAEGSYISVGEIGVLK